MATRGAAVVGGDPFAPLSAGLAPNARLVLVSGEAADPRDAASVTATVIDIVLELQTHIAAAGSHPETIVLAVATPNDADVASGRWRQALDEALVGITQSLAREIAPDHVRIVCVLGDDADQGDLASTIAFLTGDSGGFAVGATLEVRASARAVGA